MQLKSQDRTIRINDEVYALSRMLDASGYEPTGDVLAASLVYVNDHGDREGYHYRAIIDYQGWSDEYDETKKLPGARTDWHRGYVYYCIARGIKLAEKWAAR